MRQRKRDRFSSKQGRKNGEGIKSDSKAPSGVNGAKRNRRREQAPSHFTLFKGGGSSIKTKRKKRNVRKSRRRGSKGGLRASVRSMDEVNNQGGDRGARNGDVSEKNLQGNPRRN